MMSGKYFLKSHVLSWQQKVYSDWEDVKSSGRAFRSRPSGQQLTCCSWQRHNECVYLIKYNVLAWYPMHDIQWLDWHWCRSVFIHVYHRHINWLLTNVSKCVSVLYRQKSQKRVRAHWGWALGGRIGWLKVVGLQMTSKLRVFETAVPYFWCWDTKSTRTEWKVVPWNWK